MPPNQDKTSNSKIIDNIDADNYFVFYSCIVTTHKPGSDTIVGDHSRILKFSYAHQDPSMEYTSNEGKGVYLHTLVDRERKRSNERGRRSRTRRDSNHR